MTALWALVVCANVGCHSLNPAAPAVVAPDRLLDETPRELYKAVLPEYRIEPPDILQIDAVRVLPKSNYKLHPQDIVSITVFVSAETPLFHIEPAEYVVGLDGTIDLGPTYGAVPVAGLTIPDARKAVNDAILSQVKTAQVSFRVAAIPTLQLNTDYRTSHARPCHRLRQCPPDDEGELRPRDNRVLAACVRAVPATRR